MRLAYVTATFPFALEEQFLEPETNRLAEHHEVFVIPTRARSPVVRYPNLRAIPYFLGALDLRVLRKAFAEVRRHPRAVARALLPVVYERYRLRSKIVNLTTVPKALALAHELRVLRVEHIHVNWMTTSATAVWIAARLTGLPFSITAHQHDIFTDNLIEAKVRDAAFVRVISDRNRRHLEALVAPELRARCATIHLGVDLPAQARLPAASGVFRVLCSARLCLWKGHRYLLPAIARLVERGIDVRCDLAGDGEIRRDVERLVRALGLGDRVRMLGNVPHRALVQALSDGEYDALALASTEQGNEHEGIPVAVMEAMAVGLPVVVTQTGSLAELVEHEVTGLLVPQRDVVALARALERLAIDPGLRRRLGERASRFVTESFSSAATTKELDTLFATVVLPIPSVGPPVLDVQP